MKKAKLLKIGLLVVLLAGLYLLVQGGQLFVKQAPSAPPAPPAAKAEPPAAGSSPASQQTPPAAIGGTAEGSGQSGPMALSPAPRGTDLSPASSDYTYSIRNQKKEMQLLPGVTYAPHDGVSIKTNNKDETIQLQRDHTANTDYQVLWKKKF